MMAHLSILIFPVFLVSSLPIFPVLADVDTDFANYIIKYGKTYTSDALKAIAKANYVANLKTINDQNAKFTAGTSTFSLAVNQFTDLSVDDMKKRKGSLPVASNGGLQSTTVLNGRRKRGTSIPASYDWRSQGAVTPVKDQGYCGSCWAFSSIGALESANYIKTKKLVALSEQSMVDCTPIAYPYGCNGCNGGYPNSTLQFVKDRSNKVATMASYPYTGQVGTCNSNAANGFGGNITSVTLPNSGDENALKTTIATIGPTTALMDASNAAFQSYASGVYNVQNCGTTFAQMDHAVVVVGYGTDKKLGDFWIVRNSWSADWGESGYIRIARNKGNMCGIALRNHYPVLG